jgi:pentatricopeptide repeat protein
MISRTIVRDSTKLSQLLHRCRNIHHQHQPCLPALDSHSYAHMLQQIIRNGADLNAGKHLHCHILKRGTSLDLFAQNILLNFYVQSNSVQDASKLFDEMPQTNTISFVTLAQGYSRSGQFHQALHFILR